MGFLYFICDIRNKTIKKKIFEDLFLNEKKKELMKLNNQDLNFPIKLNLSFLYCLTCNRESYM